MPTPLIGYAVEELVAEIGAAFLCADLAITPETPEDHATYIASWLKVLKDDKRAIFTSVSHAQKAADYLNGLQTERAADGTEDESIGILANDLIRRMCCGA